jgi:6-phosphogluconate dehydrogenase
MGVSGGEEGARHGPSLMPGGDRSAYDEVAAMLARIAAQVPDGPCVAYCGPGGAGHYVKMVHNGIEYGVMQLIAEAYDLLRRLGGLSNAALAATFAAWNRGELESYLLGITARIFTTIDPDTGHDLVDEVVDAAAQKGTGRWAVSDAAEIGVPVPTIAAAVDARLLSAERDLRLDAARRLPGPRPAAVPAARSEALVSSARAALYAAELCTYAQGMDLLRAASALRGWQLSLAELARIWKGGCIIRARLLSQVQEAFERDGALPNLLVDADLDDELGARQQPWREVLADGALSGVPVPALAASLGYYDMLRTPRLPANLTQAQRDYFGAHGYQRLDRPGAFHTSWSAEAEPPDPTSLR